MSEKLENARLEAIRLRERSKELRKELDLVKGELEKLKSIHRNIGQGSAVNSKELAELGISLGSEAISVIERFTIKTKLEGMILQKESDLHKKEAALRTVEGSLKSLEVCPDCNGSGMKIKPRYDRGGDSIQLDEESELCQLCEGKGRISLD